MRHRALFTALLLITGLFHPAVASTPTGIFAWQAADMALRFPLDWSQPFASQDENRLILSLAKTSSETPGQDEPLIRLIREPLPVDTFDAADLLADELRAMNLQPGEPMPVSLSEGEGITIFGTGRNRQIFGRGWLLTQPDAGTVLMLLGRTPVEQRDEFNAVFSLVTNTLVRGAASIPPEPAYGVLWLTQSFAAEGPAAFINPGGLEIGTDGRLYLVDGLAGLVILDANTGNVISTSPFRTPTRTTDMALAADGSVYAVDIQCACVQRWQNGTWSVFSQGYGPSAPRSLTMGTDGSLYVTDIQPDGRVYVRVTHGTEETRLLFEAPLTSQPLLASDAAGQIFVLTDQGEILRLEGAGFTTLYRLQVNLTSPQFNAFTVDAQGNGYIVTSGNGIVVVNAQGQEVRRIEQPATSGVPRPGEFFNPAGVAVAADGTVYIADSSGGIGTVAAMSSRVETGRVGAEQLRSGVPVQGSLDDRRRTQLWLFEARRGDVVDLLALSLQGGGLDVALQLLDPTGREIALVDNFELTEDMLRNPPEMQPANPLDAQLLNQELSQDGIYFVLVERKSGGGAYQLGFSLQQTIELNRDAPLILHGTLSDAIPLHRLAFTGRGGDIVTVTLRAETGTIDPVLILRNARGDIVAQNDNAEDVTLGQTAQIAHFRLPAGGEYVIQAMRFAGFGRYRLEIQVER